MNYKSLFVAIIISCALLAQPLPAQAQEKEAGSSATASGFAQLLSYQPDVRGLQLKRFFELYDSPLADYADVFIREADMYELDWKLVAAIAGAESTFGKHIPPGSYNAWGWGIPTGARSGIGFENWEDGIATVTRGLRTRYADRGAVTVEQMGRIYAASPRWAGNVRFFMNRIEQSTQVTTALQLEVTL